mmetsp:Transcript_32321/g.50375  ORF Transcript_32321/g.50375 Transcript_32321/m.50375 type:complete len:143 (+) Transcript_32321:429-857(+)
MGGEHQGPAGPSNSEGELPVKRKVEQDSQEGNQGKKGKKGHTGDKNIPAHRGAFKRHLRKHTVLYQREGGEVARAFIVTCDQGREAKAITSSVELLKIALGPDPEAAAGDEDTWVVDPGCNGVACVTIERKGVDPVELLGRL